MPANPLKRYLCCLFLLFVVACTQAEAQTSLPAAKKTLKIPWNSPQGIQMLERSKHKVDFFALANQFESQKNKLYCGIASTTILLNTLRLKNNKIQKPLDHSNLTVKERKHLPLWFNPIFARYTQNTVFRKEAKSKMQLLGEPVLIKGRKIHDYGLQLHQLSKLLVAHGLDVRLRVVSPHLPESVIRKELVNNMATRGDYVLVNYLRDRLGQKGGGHISPLAAYDQQTDSFLILDVSPNESGWFWVKARDLIQAMRTLDTVENRGYLLVKEGSR